MEDVLTEILERLQKKTGFKLPENVISDEEFVQMKCDSYNRKEGNLHEYDGYNCPLCKNKGDYMKVSNNAELLCECECLKTRKAIRALIRSGLKNIIKDYTFEKYNAVSDWQMMIKEAAVIYAKNPIGKWFFIGGQSGCGKTHICAAIAGEFLKAGKNVRYMVWRDDITRLKAVVTDAEAYSKLIGSYKEADVLYIDDLFKNGKGIDGKVQQPTGADIQAAFEILNYRYNNKHLVTIISSERTLYDLLDIDEAFGSRISEMTFDKGFGFNIRADRKKNYRLRNLTEI